MLESYWGTARHARGAGLRASGLQVETLKACTFGRLWVQSLVFGDMSGCLFSSVRWLGGPTQRREREWGIREANFTLPDLVPDCAGSRKSYPYIHRNVHNGMFRWVYDLTNSSEISMAKCAERVRECGWSIVSDLRIYILHLRGSR